ncbi:MAG: xylulokinase [Anaerolineae bacterium]|nr:xylulokinase [Anaerolineae bacterium]
MPVDHAFYLIGIDLGTSSVKAVLINSVGKIIDWTDEEYPLLSPEKDWAEQDPETWLAATLNVVRRLVENNNLNPAHVAGIGLAGQMHGLVCVGEDGRALRPAIIWADRRSKKQVDRLQQQIGLANLAEWTGNPPATGFMLPGWLWIIENEPDVAAHIKYLLLPKDFLRFQLTGQVGSEPSDASSTALFDPHGRCWSEPLLHELKLPSDCLPPIHESAEICGGLLPDMAAACGLLAGTPLVFGGSDVSLQALGQGIVEAGLVSCTIGTGGQLFAPMSEPVHDPLLRLHLFCHAIPNRWHMEAAILSAGLSLRWLRDRFWQGQSYETLANMAQQVEAAGQGIFFLPYLAGERTPVMDSSARAAFIGLSLEHGQAHIIRSVMEGVVFALRQGLDLMRFLNVPVNRLVATGASIRHPLWLQLQADIFNMAVFPADTPQATGLGAALLAGLGTGVFETIDQVVNFSKTYRMDVVQPNPQRVELYEKAYQTYLQIYPAINTIQHKV